MFHGSVLIEINIIHCCQDGEHSICQHEAAQAGPAATTDRGETETEASCSEQEDRTQ